MKTNLNRTITTVKEADDFIVELFNNKELFHFDDDVRECLEGRINEDEAVQVDLLVEQMFSIDGYDPFEKSLALILNNQI